MINQSLNSVAVINIHENSVRGVSSVMRGCIPHRQSVSVNNWLFLRFRTFMCKIASIIAWLSSMKSVRKGGPHTRPPDLLIPHRQFLYPPLMVIVECTVRYTWLWASWINYDNKAGRRRGVEISTGTERMTMALINIH